MRRIRLGILTPSSNTVLEPYTTAMLADLPDVTAHFSRFRVVRIALSDDALGQFEIAPMLEASRLLADAKPDVIAWSGTSAGWLGHASDERLCEAITAETGVPATTATLALNAAMDELGVKRIGLVTPYTDDIQAKILETYAAAGYEVTAERHLRDPGNFSFSTYEPEELAGMMREVAVSAPDAIVAFCTNLRSAGLARPIEAETGLPVLDSIAATVWHALVLAGVDTARVEGWGRMFARA